MTNEAKALVERLRSHDYDHAYNLKTDEELYAERDEAADLIETQAREIERLNTLLSAMNDTDVIARTMAEIERLRELISDCRGSHWLKRTEWQGSQPHLDAIWRGLVETDDTRAALGDSRDQ